MTTTRLFFASGTLEGSGDERGYVEGYLGPPLGTVEGTLSDELVVGYTSPAVLHSARVVLDGVDVSSSIKGEIRIDDDLDSPFMRASFEIIGTEFSPFATENTWTRAGTLSIYSRIGVPGGVAERLEFSGQVDTCRSSGRRLFAITAYDKGYLYAQNEVCLEIDPLLGLRRGQIAGSICQAAGLANYEFPQGQVFQKPVQGASKRLFPLLKEFGTPELWYIRTRPEDDVTEAYTAALRRAPEPPDHIWTVDEFVDFVDITPPTNIPSDWVIRGSSAVVPSEAGQQIETTIFEIEGSYAPKVAAFQQESNGDLTPTELVSVETVRPISRVVDEKTTKNGKIIRQVTDTYGWYNEAAAKWWTGGSSGALGDGDAPGGYHFTTAYVDVNGVFVLRKREVFRLTGRRIQDFFYNSNGDLILIKVATWGWLRQAQAVRRGASDLDNTPTVINAMIGSDDVSYKRQQGVWGIERFAPISDTGVVFDYDEVTGAQINEVATTEGYTRIRSRVDSGEFWVNADGVGQTELTATFKIDRIVEKSTRSQGHIVGETKTIWGYTAVELDNAPGSYDWGPFDSYLPEQRFTVIERKSRSIDVDSPDSYLEVTYDEKGGRDEKRILGKPPLPRYKSSPWTVLTSEPIEVLWESSVLRDWFGPSTKVITDDFIQSVEEGIAVIEWIRDRLLSHEIRVTRPTHYAVLGDTILVVDEEQGVAERFLLTERSRSFNVVPSLSTYVLEAPRI